MVSRIRDVAIFDPVMVLVLKVVRSLASRHGSHDIVPLEDEAEDPINRVCGPNGLDPWSEAGDRQFYMPDSAYSPQPRLLALGCSNSGMITVMQDVVMAI